MNVNSKLIFCFFSLVSSFLLTSANAGELPVVEQQSVSMEELLSSAVGNKQGEVKRLENKYVIESRLQRVNASIDLKNTHFQSIRNGNVEDAFQVQLLSFGRENSNKKLKAKSLYEQDGKLYRDYSKGFIEEFKLTSNGIQQNFILEKKT